MPVLGYQVASEYPIFCEVIIGNAVMGFPAILGVEFAYEEARGAYLGEIGVGRDMRGKYRLLYVATGGKEAPITVNLHQRLPSGTEYNQKQEGPTESRYYFLGLLFV